MNCLDEAQVEIVTLSYFCEWGCQCIPCVFMACESRQTASVYLQELERIGILAGQKKGREVVYKHPALLRVLTT